MSFNKDDLIWSDDVESLESTFFWYEEEEEAELEFGESEEDSEPEEESGDGDSSEEYVEQEDDSEDVSIESDVNQPQAEVDGGVNSTPTTAYERFAQFGPGEVAKLSDMKFHKDISTFMSKLPVVEGNKPQPYGIHGRKAAISLIAYPHKILEQKKTRKADPKIYAVIDSYASYYKDRGVFLSLFASTCERIGVETWRAEKLTSDWVCQKIKRKLDGKLLKCEWAQKAGIALGATIVFVGDGCNGNVGEGYWNSDDMQKFRKLYNVIWVSMYRRRENCGCGLTWQAEVCGWKMYHGVDSVEQLKKIKI